MMLVSAKLAPFAAALLLVAPGLIGCGGDESSPDVVASVGSRQITRSELSDARKVLCLKLVARTNGRGLRVEPTCNANSAAVAKQALKLVIDELWMSAELARQDIPVKDFQVTASRALAKENPGLEGPMKEAFARAGIDEQAYLRPFRLVQLRQALTAQLRRVPDATVRAQYERHVAKYKTGEQRLVHLLQAPSHERAAHARSLLERGVTWRKVAARHSSDLGTKNHAGVTTLEGDRDDGAVTAAVFEAAEAALVGPVKTPEGWYVFQVTRITPPSSEELGQVGATIRSALVDRRVARFERDLRRRYGARTSCKREYRIVECGGRPL